MTLSSKLSLFFFLTLPCLWAFDVPKGPPSAEAWAPPTFVPMLVEDEAP